MEQLLPRVESDAIAAVQSESERIGVTVKTLVTVEKITKANGRFRVEYEHDGEKLTVDADRMVGAHMVGHQAEELTHLFSLAMRHGIPASKLKDDMFAFPTFSSDVKNLFWNIGRAGRNLRLWLKLDPTGADDHRQLLTLADLCRIDGFRWRL